MGRPVALGGGVGTIVIVLLFVLLGGDPSALFQSGALSTGGTTTSAPRSAAEDELAEFVTVVLADTEAVWGAIFEASGQVYREPTLVLFTDQVRSACGVAGAAVGPFYCPADEQIYIDLSFYDELRRRFGAPGDFAQAYVIAHEVGHHVQNLLGVSDEVHRARQGLSPAEANRLSVRLELQADFYAGVWAHHADRMFDILEEGDLAEALNAASRIGDDRIQEQTRGRVVPDAFTHGTAAQRERWFRAGYESGDPSAGDTFSRAESEL